MNRLTEQAGYVLAQTEITTTGIREWMMANIIPLLLVVLAVLMMWKFGKSGDNAGAAKMFGPILIAFAVIGFALSGAGVDLGVWITGLFTN